MTKNFGAKVRSELFKRNMTQKELAEILGVSLAYLTDILLGLRSGKRKLYRMSFVNVEKLAK